MQGNTFQNRFIFNEKIDTGYLFSLYTDDYPYMEEVFATTLEHFDQDLESVQLAFSTENINDLKRAIHKIKPTFGFVGLLNLQSYCKAFEQSCESASRTDDIKNEYKEINHKLLEAKQLIESEYQRLKAFNTKSV